MREYSRESDSLLAALNAQRDQEAAAAAKRRRLVQEANDRTRSLCTIKKQIREAQAELQKKQAAAQELEASVAAKHALTQWSVEEFKLKKNRAAALDRIARGRNTLAEAQKAEWPAFRSSWDEAMSAEHGAAWPETFAGWLQKVANDMAAGKQNSLSEFVYRESHRVLGGRTALALPQ